MFKGSFTLIHWKTLQSAWEKAIKVLWNIYRLCMKKRILHRYYRQITVFSKAVLVIVVGNTFAVYM